MAAMAGRAQQRPKPAPGTRVRVIVAAVNPVEGLIDLELVPEAGSVDIRTTARSQGRQCQEHASARWARRDEQQPADLRPARGAVRC